MKRIIAGIICCIGFVAAHAMSTSGSAFNESMGGASIAYPWSVNQTVMINPAYPAIVKRYAGNSFFSFNYYTMQERKDDGSYSWSFSLGGVSYTHSQNRYLDQNNKVITLSRSFERLPFGEMISMGLSFRWQETAHDIDEGLNAGILFMPLDNLAVGYTFDNIIAPEINGVSEPWRMTIGAGYKPLEWLGASANMLMADNDDNRYAAGVELKPTDFYSIRAGYNAANRWTIGNGFSLWGYELNVAYEFAREGNDDNTFYISFTTGKYNFSPGWFNSDDDTEDDDVDYSDEVQ